MEVLGAGLVPSPHLAPWPALPTPNRFWFFKFLIFVGITVGAFYIPDGSFSNGRWPWLDGWGLQEGGGVSRGRSTGGGCSLPWHTDPRLLTGSSPLPSWPGDSTLVLGHMAFGQYGGVGAGGWNLPRPCPIPCHTASLYLARGSLRAGTLLLLSVTMAGHGVTTVEQINVRARETGEVWLLP